MIVRRKANSDNDRILETTNKNRTLPRAFRFRINIVRTITILYSCIHRSEHTDLFISIFIRNNQPIAPTQSPQVGHTFFHNDYTPTILEAIKTCCHLELPHSEKPRYCETPEQSFHNEIEGKNNNKQTFCAPEGKMITSEHCT